MKWLIASLMLVASPVAAQSKLDPGIAACEAVEIEQGNWAVDFRHLLDKNSSDRGGAVDAGFIADINFVLVSAKEFVHTNIQFVQRARFRGGEPSVQLCKQITAVARVEIEKYARPLLSSVPPTDQFLREDFRREFRYRLEQQGIRLLGY